MSSLAIVSIGVASLLMVFVGTATLGIATAFTAFICTVFAVIITGLLVMVLRGSG